MTNLSLRAFRANTGVPVAGGVRTPMRTAGFQSVRPWLNSRRPAAETWWWGQSMTPLLVNGPVGAKLTIAVVGDGFARADQDKYNQAVDSLLMSGMFAHDFYAANKSAFNIYRINLESVDSGVSTKTYAADGTVASQVDRDTALNLYYSGDWGHCWLEGGANHERALTQALSIWLPDYTYLLVLLNNPGFGGCGGGGRAYVPLGVDWSTVAHEFGHAFGLADEYCGSNAWTGGEPGAVNLTANTDRQTLKWGSFVAGTTPLPSGNCSGWTNGTKPAGWNDNTSVGLFAGGGGHFDRGVFRPVIDCRMRSNTPPFCPVCRQHMDGVAAPHQRVAGGKESAVTEGYVRMVVRYAAGRLSIVDARDVAGPLAQPDTLTSGLAHEVRVGGRRVALGSLPDVATNRGFENVGRGGPVPHHTYERDEFDFVVRAPREALRGTDPGSLSVELVEIRTDGRAARVGSGRLADDPGLAARPVASLRPAVGDLPAALRQALESQ